MEFIGYIDLKEYNGGGFRYFKNGSLQEIRLTREQQREKDREYRDFLISKGKLHPAE